MMRALARWSAQNPVAANVLMVLIFIGGFMAVKSMRREMFPQFSLDMIVVSVPYPGASPEEVEDGITIRVEEQVEGIDGIEKITSSSNEGMGSVVLELESSANAQMVYNDVKNAIDRIVTFPEEAEEPVLNMVVMRRDALFVPVYGDASDKVLRRLAEDIRDEITDLPQVSVAYLSGAKPYEISIEVQEEDLRRYGLTFQQVAAEISRNSLDLPGGRMQTPQGDIMVRAKGQRYTGREFASIPLLTLPDGGILRVGDVARVRDAFEGTDRYSRYGGKPAVVVGIQHTDTEDIIEVVDAVKSFVERRNPTLPRGVALDACFDASLLVRDRLNLLVKNGIQGLLLVFLTLGLFLRWKLAFWVAMGIPISFMGAFVILYFLGGTLNMISLFAFIMALGIVVDDAIIVGEHIHARYRQGDSPFRAAVEGCKDVGMPVTIAILTSIAAFCPMLFVSGIMGKFISVLPMAIIATLAVSLMEAFLILPAHMKHSLEGISKKGQEDKPGLRHRVIQRVIDGFYGPWFLKPALRYRYLTLALALAAIVMSVGLFAGGRLSFQVFPKFDSNYISGEVHFPEGTPVEVTERAIEQMERGIQEVNAEFGPEIKKKNKGEERGLVQAVMAFVGETMRRGSESGSSGGHVGQVFVELIPSEKRPIDSNTVLAKWREATGEIPGVEELAFKGGRAGPGGSPIEIQLLGRDLEKLSQAAEELKEKLATYNGVYDISDNFAPGKWEYVLRLKPSARALGVTLSDIAQQARHSFYGAEAQRIQRGRNEVKVMARYTYDERHSRAQLEKIRIRTPQGEDVPLREVATVEFGRGYSTIHRNERRRAISVTADLDETKANSREILMDLTGKSPRFKEGEKPFLPSLAQKYKVQFDLEGQARTTRESVGSLFTGFKFALVAIFCLLAAQFRSYIQPIIVMFAIPVALTGVFIGHLLMGFDLSLMSLFGVVALAGIVVNDSLVLIDFINVRIRDGLEMFEAVIDAAKSRFRAIILTSLTTVAGLLPLLAEQSMQAQFLMPMAISIAFGLMSATFLTLLVTPALYMIVADGKKLLGMPVALPIEEE